MGISREAPKGLGVSMNSVGFNNLATGLMIYGEITSSSDIYMESGNGVVDKGVGIKLRECSCMIGP